MTKAAPHNDDGLPIRAMGGRPPKPDLTAAEWEAIGLLGNMEAAALVSEMRGANLGSLSRAVANNRRVSHDWIRIQRRKTQPTQNPDSAPVKHSTKNQYRVSHTGPRTGYSTVQESPAISEPSSDPGQQSFAPKVDSEHKEATA